MKKLLFGLVVIFILLITACTRSTPTLAAGATITSEKDGMLQVYVPEGEFEMGSVESYSQATVTSCVNFGDYLSDCQKGFADEKPAHTVYLNSFWIDRSEVTNAMYEKCVSAGACQAPFDNGSYTRENYYPNDQYAQFPVIYVDWYMARAYCAWAGRRLPSEAEWEKAARGTDGRIYPWGDENPSEHRLNFCDRRCSFDWADQSVDDGYFDTAPVGSYPEGASPYGLVDMAGNVWEWVADWYAEDYYSQTLYDNPTGPSSGEYRVLRGGSWNSNNDNVRSIYRCRNSPDSAINKYGFRCAVSVTSPD